MRLMVSLFKAIGNEGLERKKRVSETYGRKKNYPRGAFVANPVYTC